MKAIGQVFRPRGWSSVTLLAICVAAGVFTAHAGLTQEARQPASQNSNPAAPPSATPGQTGVRGQGRGIYADLEHPVLPIGSALPDFDLPGIDGKMHSASEYKSAKVLAIVFESNHCPVSIAYEGRLRQLYYDYRDKGFQLVAINPNNASAVRLNELGYTDSTDDMDDMKIRAKLRNIDWPYLYDGETQKIAAAFGAVATPHIFIFDRDRTLRYEGRIDDSTDIKKIKVNDARNAIDAVLADQPVPVASTHAFGCSTKWLDKATGVEQETAKINLEPVTLTSASEDDLKNVRANNTGKTVIVEFWSLNCEECLASFHDYETTYRMYRLRKFDLIDISTDTATNHEKVLDYLKQQHASGTNLQLSSGGAKDVEAAFGQKWNTREPFVMVIGPDGKVIYEKAGKPDILAVRRHVLATIPNDGPWFGVQEYWTEVIKAGGQ